MKSKSKLKWNQARVLAYLGFAYLITLIAEDQLFGSHYSTWFWGAVWIIWGLTQSIRTKIVFYGVLGILAGLGAWHYELAVHADTALSMPTFVLHLVVILAVLLLWGIKILSQQSELEANARRIFELAASQIEETANGFTTRPFAGGKMDYTNEEIQGFARFMTAAQIVRAKFNPDHTTLMFSLTQSPLATTAPDQVSYVSFDNKGQVMAQISRSDYRQYKEQLTFDQLCAALTGLFKRFLQYYRQGQESRILVELKNQIGNG